MKLLVVSHPCAQAINQNFFARLTKESDWTVTIVVPRRWRSEYGTIRTNRFREFDGRLILKPVLLSGNIPLHLYVTSFRMILAHEKPTAIYVHHEPYAMATFQLFLAARRFPDMPIGFYSAQNLIKAYPWPVRAFERYVYRRASFALPVSTGVAQVLNHKGYRGPSIVLPLAVDTNFYCPDDALSIAERSMSQRLTVGYVGRLTPEKGVDTLLSALRMLPSDRIRALVVGDGPDRRALESRIHRSSLRDRVALVGYVPHDRMPDAYRRMDVLVIPSKTTAGWKEQFGRVVLEALACAVPVVASDSGELAPLLASTRGGWIFPEGDASALAAILESVLAQPNERRLRGLRGRTAVEQDFDLGVIARRFMRTVDAAASAKSTSTLSVDL